MDFILGLATLGLMTTLVYGVILKIKKRAAKKVFITSLVCLGIMLISSFFVEETPKTKKAEPANATIKDEDDEKKKAKEEKDPIEIDKDYYTKNYQEKVSTIMKEYDKLWNENWRPAMKVIADTPEKFKDIKDSMDKIEEGYGELNVTVIDLEVKGMGKENNEALSEYRENISKAISYRGNAGRAINQAIDGTADLNSRFEEAEKSVELSDKYVIEAAISLTKLENNLGLIKEE